MLGAIAGDIAGSCYEFSPVKKDDMNFPLFKETSQFTDDTILTLAVAKAIMEAECSDTDSHKIYTDNLHELGREFHKAGYGGRFNQWLMSSDPAPYNSFGNGSAMRVSPVGWSYDTLEEVERQARISAEVTHNHPEGIKGACAVAGAIFLARQGKGKNEIKEYITSAYGYDLDRSLADIKKNYGFNETCQGSVPEAIIAFLESSDYESAIRNAISLGGDADTQAAIAGSIAEAFYGGVPVEIERTALAKLPEKLLAIYNDWKTWQAERIKKS